MSMDGQAAAAEKPRDVAGPPSGDGPARRRIGRRGEPSVSVPVAPLPADHILPITESSPDSDGSVEPVVVSSDEAAPQTTPELPRAPDLVVERNPSGDADASVPVQPVVRDRPAQSSAGAKRSWLPFRRGAETAASDLSANASADVSPLEMSPLILGDTARTGVADATPAKPRRIKKSWREQRWERRRRRRAVEEILGWILVPIILLSGYAAVKAGLNAVGTTPTALIQGIKAAVSGRS